MSPPSPRPSWHELNFHLAHSHLVAEELLGDLAVSAMLLRGQEGGR